MTLRDARAGALIRRHRDLADDFTRTLPLLLDDLDAIDRAQVPEPVAVKREDDALSDAEIGEWIRTHEREFAAWVRKQNRINGAPPPFDAPASKPSMTSLPPAAPAKPATRRRTTR